MKIECINVMNSPHYREYIKKIVNECDNEFFPPLSARGGTTEKQLRNKVSQYNGVDAYINDLLKQVNIFASNEDGILMGFMSIIHDRQDEPIFHLSHPGTHNYISTVCVDKKHRRLGICSALYDFVENELPHEFTSGFTSTRTWCGNKSHIILLEKRGYEHIHTIENDRNHNGETANTVFYVKKNKPIAEGYYA